MNNSMLASADTRNNNTMKALASRRYGGPDVVTIEEVAKPVPQAGDLLIRNHASVVTAAMCHARAGREFSARLYFGLSKPKWPILGTNFSGVIEAVGSSVTRFRVGDQVAGTNATSFGAFAEYLLVAEDGAVVPRPANLSDSQAVAVFDGAVTALPFLLVPVAHQHLPGVFPRPHHIADRLRLQRRDGHLDNLPEPQQLREMLGIAGIGLDPVAARALQLRRGSNLAIDSCRDELTGQAEPGRAGLIRDNLRARQ